MSDIKDFWPIQIKYLKATKTKGARLKVTSIMGSTVEPFDDDLGHRDVFGKLHYCMSAEKRAVEHCKFYGLSAPMGIGRLQNGDYVAMTPR